MVALSLVTGTTVTYKFPKGNSKFYIDSRLFSFSRKALVAGGPSLFLMTEILSCIMLYFALDPLTEIMVYESSGLFISFADRYIDPACAFTVR